MLSRRETTSLSNSHVSYTEASKDGELPRGKFYSDLWDSPDSASDSTTEKELSEKKLSEKELSEKEKVSPPSSQDGVVETEEGYLLIPPYQPALHSEEWELVHFAPTPRMSTYLVAIANGDLR